MKYWRTGDIHFLEFKVQKSKEYGSLDRFKPLVTSAVVKNEKKIIFIFVKLSMP